MPCYVNVRFGMLTVVHTDNILIMIWLVIIFYLYHISHQLHLVKGPHCVYLFVCLDMNIGLYMEDN